MVESPAPSTPLPSVAEALGWIGFAVDDASGARVGRVHGAFADAGAAEAAWLIVSLRRRLSLFGRRRAGLVAIPLRDCAAAGGRVWTAQEHEALRTAPTVDPTRPLLREHELAICAHFGISERIGRAAEVYGRAEASVTAQPPNP